MQWNEKYIHSFAINQIISNGLEKKPYGYKIGA